MFTKHTKFEITYEKHINSYEEIQEKILVGVLRMLLVASDLQCTGYVNITQIFIALFSYTIALYCIAIYYIQV